MQGIVYGICGVLLVWGLWGVMKIMVHWLLSGDVEEPLTVVVVPKGPEDCEMTVRGAAERLQRLEKEGTYRLICLNQREDPEMEKICSLLSLRYPYLQVSKKEDLVYHILEEDS